MNNNVPVNDLNTNDDPADIVSGVSNGICTIKCIASTSSIDDSGDYRITRRLECLWKNQGLNSGEEILNLEIAGSKGTTPVVTVNEQVVPVGSLAFDVAGNLEVRSIKGVLLDIVNIPDKCAMSAAGLGMVNAGEGADLNYGTGFTMTGAFLGIAARPVSSDLAHNLGIEPCSVCVISEVVPGSPAFGSGIEANDVLLSINGKKANLATLRREIETAKTGDQVTLTYFCKGVKHETTVQLVGFEWTKQPTRITSEFKYPLNPGGETSFPESAGGPGVNSGGCALDVNSPIGVAKTWMSAGALI
jgi:hypothetical protein